MFEIEHKAIKIRRNGTGKYTIHSFGKKCKIRGDADLALSLSAQSHKTGKRIQVIISRDKARHELTLLDRYCTCQGSQKEKEQMVAARFELARTFAHWESSKLKSNALDQLGHATDLTLGCGNNKVFMIATFVADHRSTHHIPSSPSLFVDAPWPAAAKSKRPALKYAHDKKREIVQTKLNKSLEQGLNLSGS